MKWPELLWYSWSGNDCQRPRQALKLWPRVMRSRKNDAGEGDESEAAANDADGQVAVHHDVVHRKSADGRG